MSKHRLSPSLLPPAKRQHTSAEQKVSSATLLNFDISLYDELVLVIFSHLSWYDLCVIQPTNHLWARLAADNQLWKKQFITEYGRLRLRGSRGFFSKHDNREVRHLPHTRITEGHVANPDHIDWKWMFRISSNWRRGRCELVRVKEPNELAPDPVLRVTMPSCALLAGSLVVTTSSEALVSPPVYLHKAGSQAYPLTGKHRERISNYITALSLDQSPPSCNEHRLRLAAFYDTGEFSIFLIDHNQPQHSRLLLTYLPRGKSGRTAPIRQAVYHHPLLVTLSQSFKLCLYDLSNDDVKLSQTLSSFTSFPPTSMVLTSGLKNYRLVLAYSAPVYPADWSAAVTVLTISPAQTGFGTRESEDESVPRPCSVTLTRTIRTFDVPSGWIDELALRTMRDQWGRRAARVADVQTDGKWVVLAPADRLSFPSSPSTRGGKRVGTTACALQLYRLHIPTLSTSTSSLRLTFVRNLYGHIGPVVALALADGRCVSRGVDGSLWVWDLERGTGVEIQTARNDSFPYVSHGLESSSSTATVPRSNSSAVSAESASESEQDEIRVDDDASMGIPLGAVVFDERRIMTADAFGIEMRRFDI